MKLKRSTIRTKRLDLHACQAETIGPRRVHKACWPNKRAFNTRCAVMRTEDNLAGANHSA